MFKKKNYPNLDIPKKIVFCPLTGNIMQEYSMHFQLLA